jgi:hypothetical protein
LKLIFSIYQVIDSVLIDEWFITFEKSKKESIFDKVNHDFN